MDIGLLLLLVLALAIGWFLGYRSSASQKLSSVQSFLKNWGFNTQPTSSIDEIQSVIELDSEGFDTYIGLGNTYRKRGDTPKAVELHQFLQKSDKLSQEQKQIAELEEALDYQAAGFFDKAEEVLLRLLGQLTEQSLTKNKALKTLVSVYARQRNWSNASETALQLSRYDERYHRVAAHIVAEDIEFQIHSGANASQVKKQLNELEKLDESSPRLAVLKVKLAENETDLTKFSEAAIAGHPQTSGLIMQAMAQFFDDNEAIKAFLTKALPSWDQAARYNFCLAFSKRQQELAESVSVALNDDMLSEAIENTMQFFCERCGFHTGVFAWQCPQCKSWGLLNLKNSYKVNQ